MAEIVRKPVLTHNDFDRHSKISSSTLVRRFGKWRTTLERAGLASLYPGLRGELVVRHPRPKYSDEAMLEEIRRVSELTRVPGLLTMTDFESHSSISHRVVRRRFGDWRTGLEHARLGHLYSGWRMPGYRPYGSIYADDFVLDELRRVARLVQKDALTRRDFDRHSQICSETVVQRFKGWRPALEQAGIGRMYVADARASREPSDEDVYGMISQLAARIGRDDPPRREFSAATGISVEVIRRRFGSWANALAKAGLSTPRTARRYSTEQCLENVAKLWMHFGTPPSWTRLGTPPSSVGSKAYQTRWGAMSKVLEAFREWLDSQQQPTEDKRSLEPSDTERPEAEIVTRFLVMRRDGFRCAARGRGPAGRDGVELHVERAIPLSDGGKNPLAGLRTRCRNCDGSKDAEGTVPARRVRLPGNCSDEVLLDEVRRVARLVGNHELTQAEFGRLSGFSSGVLKRRFGDWGSVLKRAGVRRDPSKPGANRSVR